MMLLGWHAGADVLPKRTRLGESVCWLWWAMGGLPAPVPCMSPAPAVLGGICIKGLVTWLRAWTPVK